MKKKFSLMFIAPFLATTISMPLLIEEKNTSLNNSAKEINNELSSIINQKSNEKGIIDGDFYLDKYNGIKPYRRGSEIDFNASSTNPNMLCSGKNGYITGWTNGRGVDLVSFSGEYLWSWNSTWSNFQIKDAIYLPRCDKYIVTYFSSDYGFRFITLDPDTGRLYRSSTWDGSLKTTSNQYSSRVYTVPVLSDSGSVTDKFIVFSRDWLSSSSGKCYVEVKVNSDGTYTSKKVSLARSSNDEDYLILSAGSVQIGNDVYFVSTNVYQSKNIWMTVYKNGTFLYEKDTGIDASWNSNRDEFLTTVDDLSSDMDVYYRNGSIYINWYSNLNTSNYIKSYSFSTSSNPSNSNFNDKSISLQPSNDVNFDIDAYNVTYNNGVILARGKIFSGANQGNVILKINSRASAGVTWVQNNFNPDNKSYDSLYSIYNYTGDIDYTTKKLIPLLSYSNTEQYSQNMALFCTDQSSDMRKSFQVIKEDGNYAYQTKLKQSSSNKIALENVNSVKLNSNENYADMLANNYLTSSIIKSNVTGYFEGSNYSVETDPLSFNDALLGQIPARIIIQNGYDGTTSSTKPITLDVIFTGFKTQSTSVVAPTKPITTLSTYLAQDVINSSEVKTLLYDFIATNCFTEVPTNFNASNIKSVKYYGFNNEQGVLNVSEITINNWYNENGQLQNTEQTFSTNFSISGFAKSVPTSIRSNLIETTMIVEDVRKISSDLDYRNQVEKELTNWIKNNFTKVFVGLPQSFTSDNVVSVSIDISTINTSNNSAQYYITLNNVFLNNSNCEHVNNQEIQYGPTYFKFQSGSNLNAKDEGIQLWIWIAIGAGSFVLILCILLLIILKKKKNSKKKQKNIQPIKKPNTAINRLAGPTQLHNSAPGQQPANNIANKVNPLNQSSATQNNQQINPNQPQNLQKPMTQKPSIPSRPAPITASRPGGQSLAPKRPTISSGPSNKPPIPPINR